MSVLHPILLAAGLACVAIPILIHLFMRRRRKPVQFGAMRFLLEAYRRKRRRLAMEQWLLLLLRCLLIACLAGAIARLGLGDPARGGAGGRTIVLAIDDSLTSAASTPGDQAELARHLELAASALDALDAAAGDRAAVVSLSRPPRVLVSPTGDLAGVRRALAGITPTDARADLRGGLEAALALIPPDAAPRSSVLIASSFREGSLAAAGDSPSGAGETASDGVPRAEAEADIGSEANGVRIVALSPAPAPAPNVSIESLVPGRTLLTTGDAGAPSGAGALPPRVTLVRTGDAGDERIGIELLGVDDEVLGRGEAVFAPGERRTEALVQLDDPPEDAPGGSALRARIRVGDAIERDSSAATVLRTRASIRVALLGGAPPSERTAGGIEPDRWIEIALSPGGVQQDLAIERFDASLTTPAALVGIDAVVVTEPARLTASGWAALGDRARAGAFTLVTASPGEGVQPWTGAFARAFDLAWSPGPEALEAPAPLGIARGEALDLLAAIAQDLPDLLAPADVSRWLPVRTLETGASPRVLLALENNDPWLVSDRAGAATGAAADGGAGLVCVLLSAPDLSWTSAPAKPLWVPLIQELIREGAGSGNAPRTAVAGERVRLPRGSARLVDTRTGSPIETGTEGLTREPIRRAARLAALDPNGRTVSLLVIAPDPTASNTTPGTRDAVASSLSRPGDTIAWFEAGDRTNNGARGASLASALRSDDTSDVATWLLLVAGLLAVIEIALARVASHASRSEVSR
ncbi:MAG: BatA domain-containing protein [Planctomycetota bacterium]